MSPAEPTSIWQMAGSPAACRAVTVLAGLRMPSMSYTTGFGAGWPFGSVAPVPMSLALVRLNGWSISHCHGTFPSGGVQRLPPEAVPGAGVVAAIPTIGSLRVTPPVDPWNTASPREKIPPSDATSQYPPPSGVAAIPTIGWLSLKAPVDPWNAASPREKIPPSEATNQ